MDGKMKVSIQQLIKRKTQMVCGGILDYYFQHKHPMRLTNGWAFESNIKARTVIAIKAPAAPSLPINLVIFLTTGRNRGCLFFSDWNGHAHYPVMKLIFISSHSLFIQQHVINTPHCKDWKHFCAVSNWLHPFVHADFSLTTETWWRKFCRSFTSYCETPKRAECDEKWMCSFRG